MPYPQATGIALALGAAAAWGGADFCGGLASRRNGAVQVLVSSRLAGLACYLTVAVVAREAWPPAASVCWALAAGMVGSLGIAALYLGLAADRAALVVPTSGVVGAAIPVAVAALVAGMLPPIQQAGLLLAIVGIFLVSRSDRGERTGWLRGLVFGSLAGVGFGGFFLCLAQVAPGHVFTPLALVGVGSSAMAGLVMTLTRTRRPSPGRQPAALLAGALDATGAVSYLLAVGWIRLDVAAVLASIYPAITVLLFRGVLREPVSRAQWVGLALCVLAIGMIAR
jgi:drug/metabolite transporter (DMT)-like permease